ncbi:MAG: hypothetical protein NTY22_00720 [Proteobacteria bacterium]|nr:hypothetical protein [Pseudomonadota bacterium]
MMKRLIIVFLLLFAYDVTVKCDAASVSRTSSTSKKKNKKTRQFIDLEGLDIQGMIDRPQTLYILKKSDLNFSENYDEYDYMSAIIDTTYQEPF